MFVSTAWPRAYVQRPRPIRTLPALPHTMRHHLTHMRASCLCGVFPAADLARQRRVDHHLGFDEAALLKQHEPEPVRAAPAPQPRARAARVRIVVSDGSARREPTGLRARAAAAQRATH